MVVGFRVVAPVLSASQNRDHLVIQSFGSAGQAESWSVSQAGSQSVSQ